MASWTTPRARRTGWLGALTFALVAASALTGALTAPSSAAFSITFSSVNGVTIPDAGQGSPYPSTVSVSDLPGNITDVEATLVDLKHGCMSDLNVVLVSPAGQALSLMYSQGGCPGETQTQTYTFDDASGASLPRSPAPNGSYKPYGGGPAQWGVTPTITTLAGFNDVSPIGTWKLFVMDMISGNQGSIDRWTLSLTTDGNPQPQTISFGATPTGKAVGSPSFQANASATSGLPVAYSLGAGTTNAACTVSSSGTVSIAHAGTCQIAADQSGSSTYLAATPVTQAFTVAKANQTVSFTSTPPADIDLNSHNYPANANATTGGAVTFSAGPGTTNSACTVSSGGTVNFQAVGTCQVRATQAGSNDYNSATADQNITVGKGAQTISFTTGVPAFVDIGDARTVAAISGGGSGNPVVITIAPGSAGMCTLSGGVVKFTGSGQCEVRANRAGDASYLAAPQVTQTFKVRKAQEVRITSKPTLMSTLGGKYQVTASVTSGLFITLAIGPGTTNGACTINGTTVTLVRNGSCAITASQAGNGDWSPAPTITQVFAVTRNY